MHQAPLVVVLILWTVSIVLYLIIQWRWSRTNPKNPVPWYSFEQLNTYCDGCSEISGRYAYLLRLIYSRFNKRFFLPSANISVQMLDEHGRTLANVVINSSVLVANHRRYMKVKSQEKQLYGKIEVHFFCCCTFLLTTHCRHLAGCSADYATDSIGQRALGVSRSQHARRCYLDSQSDDTQSSK